MRRLTLLALCCVPAIAFADMDPETLRQMEANLPVVSVGAIAQANKEASDEALMHAAVAKAAEKTTKAKPSESVGPKVIRVRPGINEIIPIATGHANRIMMPFDTPQTRTTSNAGFEVEGRVLYVSSSDEGRPITTFVNEAGEPELALSLTFVPQRMPPVEVIIKIDEDYLPAHTRGSKRAQQWEVSHPYLITIRELLRKVAVGETPQGYTLHNSPILSTFTGCVQPGLDFNFVDGQSVEGNSLRVNVGVATNTSSQRIEFREPSCAGYAVKAVTAWPRYLLEPGEQTEVFVVTDPSISTYEAPTHNTRRSLLEN